MELIEVTVTKVATRDKSVINLVKKTYLTGGIEYIIEDNILDQCARVLESLCIKEPDGTVKYLVTLKYDNNHKSQYMIDPSYNLAVENIERKLRRINI